MTAIADDSEIRSTLASHASQLSTLGQNVSVLNVKLDKVLDGFSELRANRGPSLVQILSVCALVAAIVSAIAGGITYMVRSSVNPDIISLSGLTTTLQRAEDDRMRSDRAELHQLRRQYSDRLESRIRELEMAQGWGKNVTVK